MQENILFEGLPPNKRTELMKNSIFKKAKKNSYIFREGDKVDSIIYIISGTIKLRNYDSAGNERIVGIFSDNEFLWECILMEDSTYPYNCVCETSVRYYKIMKEDFEKALNSKTISKNIIVLLSRKLHDANERNMFLAAEDPTERLARFLCYSESRRDGDYIELSLNDIAASVNLRPETVSRKLREIEKDGLIKRAGKCKIEITDFEGLNALYNVQR
ncbi:MAG: Crp/Fnr family transcriptional regulator [Eubacterium sp.]|nr:Crp/Fnr family transcriptional regulator [Eubacterium sp.]